MEPNSLEYQKSIAMEFNAIKDRVRNLIGSTHWGEEGSYKEVMVMKFLKKFLPNNIEVGTGFIKEKNNTSTQIDIIIYDSTLPLYFKENNFVIVQPKSVLGIIEVKSNPNKNEIAAAIFKANNVGQLIKDDFIFNGLFILGSNKASTMLKKPRENSEFKKSLLDALSKNNSLNHIVLNDGIFMKKWSEKNKFSCYAINELATSYFFANLLNVIYSRNQISIISEAMYEHLYPIPEGKSKFLKWEV